MADHNPSQDLAAKEIGFWERYLARRRMWEAEWKDLADYIVPRKAITIRNMVAGSKTTSRIFSSTAIKANEDLASTMMGTLTNPSIRWFSLVFPFAELNEDPDASQWLDEASDRMFNVINQSNFSSEFQEAYIDLGGFGIACVFETERVGNDPEFNGLLFKSLSIGEYVVAENAEGRVDTVYRKFLMSASMIKKKWPNMIEKLEHVKKALEADKPDETFEILHAVHPREDSSQALNAAPRKRPVTDIFVCMSDKVLLQEGGFHEFPYLTPRWSKDSREEYGRGPGHTSLPDVKTLNRARELKLRQWAKAVDPPMQALDRAVIGTVRMIPSGLNFVREKDAIKPIESGARFDVASLNEGELMQSIREIFFSDLTGLPPVQGTPMSATEAAERFELMERKLGPTIGRLRSELLAPAIDRTFGIMFRRGLLPPIPPSVVAFFQRVGKISIHVKYEGPLERAQRASDIAVIERTYTQLGGVASLEPSVIDVYDHDAIARRIGERNGLPLFLMRTEKRVQQIRQAKAQQAQQAADVAQAETQAKTLKAGAAAAKDASQVAPQGG